MSTGTMAALLGLLHDALVDRDRRQPAIFIVDGGLASAPCSHQSADPFDPTSERGLMAADLVQNRCGAPDEHAAVPIIVARLEILRRLGGIRFFDESADRMALERSRVSPSTVFGSA